MSSNKFLLFLIKLNKSLLHVAAILIASTKPECNCLISSVFNVVGSIITQLG